MKNFTVLNRTAFAFLFCSWFLFSVSRALAVNNNATWNAVPTDGNWNNNANWDTAAPNDPTDTATFDTSSVISLFLSANTEVDGIVFNANASAFTITASPTFTLTISGAGITNNSGIMQNFVADVDGSGNFGLILFLNSASAGTSTTFTNNGSTVSGAFGGLTQFFGNTTAGTGTFTTNGGAVSGAGGGSIDFFDTSNASNGIFTNNAGTVDGAGGGLTAFQGTSSAGHGTFTNNAAAFGGTTGAGAMVFFNTSTAGNAIITNNGSGVGGFNLNSEGQTQFVDNSTAGSATITNQAAIADGGIGGVTFFSNSATAGNATLISNGGTTTGTGGDFTQFSATSSASSATLIANGGSGGGDGGGIRFLDDSTSGTARVEVFGNGYLDISLHNAPGVTIGSIEGSGNAFLGATNLTVGSNNMSTTLSGAIQDGGAAGGTGGSFTKIGTGTLTLSGPNTYTGATAVNAGTLLVNGSITSAVTVNNSGTLGGSGIVGAVTINNGGTLSPGNSPGILNTTGNLTLTMGATYLVELNGTAVGTQYDQTNVAGLVSLGNSTLTVSLGFTPANGTMFTIINNDLSDPVTGTFNGLAEGAQFTAGGETFQISYHGGDGNDAVLTAVAAVPEPATWKMMCIGTTLLVAFQWYRRRSGRA